jgi:hypothetical protein
LPKRGWPIGAIHFAAWRRSGLLTHLVNAPTFLLELAKSFLTPLIVIPRWHAALEFVRLIADVLGRPTAIQTAVDRRPQRVAALLVQALPRLLVRATLRILLSTQIIGPASDVPLTS